MGSRFDNFQRNMVGKVHGLFAYPASWTPSDGVTPIINATVLFKDPTRDIGFVDWTGFKDTHVLAEYKFNDFPNLRDMANLAGSEEVLMIDEEDGIKKYFVRQVVKKYDGKTLIAILEVDGDPPTVGLDTGLDQEFTTPT